jgi:chaperone required for assembly of F1-ATPase
MKRFYTAAGVAEDAEGFTVVLDGRPVRTPGKRRLTVARRALAEAIAAEWAAQGERIAPAEMRLTRLANSAIDHVALHREEVRAAVARFAATDLVCYRAADPADLAARQAERWQPLLDWLAARYGVSLAVADAVLPVAQPREALARLAAVVAEFDDAGLTALHSLAAACGSLVLAIAVAAGRLDAQQAWAASQLDETYQIEKWGEDVEAAARRAALRADIAAAARVLELCRG